MSLVKKYESIDQSKLKPAVRDILKKMKDKSENFTKAEVNKKVEPALDKLLVRLEKELPEAIKKPTKKATKPKKEAKTKATKKSSAKKPSKKASQTKSTKPKKQGSKEHISTRASKLAKKEGISFKEARARISKETKEKESKETQSALDELQKLITSTEFQKDLTKFPKKNKGGERKLDSDLERDAKRPALPRGKRTSKSGKTYYEYRDNRSDVRQSGYPYLADGGAIESLKKDMNSKLDIHSDYYKDGGNIDGFTLNTVKGVVNKPTEMLVEDVTIDYEDGGKTQGYNDRLDESLGMRNRKGINTNQTYKDRRDESKGMEKAMGRRAYQSVGTMDKMAKGGRLKVYDESYDVPIKTFNSFEKAKNWVLANHKKYDEITIEDAYLDTIVVDKTDTKDDIEFLFSDNMAKGGRTISIVNDGVKFDKSKYKAIYGDFDKDGTVNIDDANPLDSSKKGKVEQIELRNTFDKLLNVKAELDTIMYDAVDTLDEKAPKDADIYARTKTPYSIIKKLVEKRMLDPKKGLTDMIGTTIAVKNQKELEQVRDDIDGGLLGKVLDRDDFYKTPNAGYRAYHYIVEYKGVPVEVQLKTKNMKKLHEVSHEAYKNGNLDAKSLDSLSKTFMEADKGDAKAKAEISKLLSDKKALASKISNSQMAKGGMIEEWSIQTDNNDEHFDNEEDAREFWESLSNKERKSGQYFRKSYFRNQDGELEEDEVEIIEEYAKGGEIETKREFVEVVNQVKEENEALPNDFVNVMDSINAILQDRGYEEDDEYTYDIRQEILDRYEKKVLDNQGLRFAKGGKIGFDGLAKKVAKSYEGKPVEKQFQDEYGKTYSKEEAMEVGKKVAGKVYREQQAMAKGGVMKTYDDFGKDYDAFTDYVMDRISLEERRKIRKQWNESKSKMQWQDYLLKEVNKKSMAKGGEVIEYSKVYEILKDKIDDSVEDIESTYEQATNTKGEEVESKSRDGFIPFTNGGYSSRWFEYSNMLEGSGMNLPTASLDEKIEEFRERNREYGFERFEEEYPEIVEELGGIENVNYSALEDAGYSNEADDLDMFMEDDEDSIMMEVEAYYYNPNNDRGEDGKHTIQLSGVVNLEAPYHRSGNLEDYIEERFTFDSYKELEDKLDKALVKVVSWFEGDMYDKTSRELKIRRMEAGGTLPTPFGQAGLVGETGAMNEMDLFAMGGGLPQGVHQYYGQTYNPAYPTPHGYAKGGKLDLDEYYSKMIDKLGKEGAFERVLKDSQFGKYKGQTDYQHNRLNKSAIINDGKVFLYDNKPKGDGSLKYSNKKTFTSPKDLAEYLDENEIFAKGGKTKRSKHSLMQDRRRVSKESWEVAYQKRKKKKMEAGGTLPTPFGQAGLVGETGAMNEMDMFAMGGGLPQGVHQYYANTYNPAYPTPHGYAKGGEVTSFGLSFTKDDYDVNVDANDGEKNIEVDVNIKKSDSVNQLALNETNAKWTQFRWGYIIYPKDKNQLYQVLKALKVNVSKKRLDSYFKNRTYAKGGKTQGYNDKLDESLGNTKGKRSTKEQNYKDRRNESEAMEKKGGKRKYSRVKTMDKGNRKKRQTPMTLAKEIRKEGEKWQDAVKRASAMLKKK